MDKTKKRDQKASDKKSFVDKKNFNKAEKENRDGDSKKHDGKKDHKKDGKKGGEPLNRRQK